MISITKKGSKLNFTNWCVAIFSLGLLFIAFQQWIFGGLQIVCALGAIYFLRRYQDRTVNK
ncbi:hypothetical protein YA68_02800 [Lactococcus garvieae]|nr:hypothetical protein YA68_02800 [Lactococcus garvieae]